MIDVKIFLDIKKNSVVLYKLFLDVEFESDVYSEKNKSISFLGQIGVYENSEKLLSLIKNLYRDLNFFPLKEKFDLEKKNESLNMFFKAENKIFDYDNNIKKTFSKFFSVKQDLKYEEDEKYFFLFLPLIMIFFKGNKKIDYYLRNKFKEKLFLDVEFEIDVCNKSSKLTSFLGQIGVYKNSEESLDLFENLYSIFLLLKEELYFEEQVEAFKIFFKLDNDYTKKTFSNNCSIFYYLKMRKINKVTIVIKSAYI